MLKAVVQILVVRLSSACLLNLGLVKINNYVLIEETVTEEIMALWIRDDSTKR